MCLNEFEHNICKRDDSAETLKTLRTRRISKTSRKRHCYPTLEEALKSFKIRKQMQLQHANRAVKRATYALEHVEYAQKNNTDIVQDTQISISDPLKLSF